MPFSDDVLARLDADAAQIIARYPRPRSALLPLLHLVQSEEGYVSEDGIAYCAAKFGLTEAEVTAVVSFYTMYKRRPVGDYHVGVCTNTLCAIMGGDQIFADLKDHLGVGNDETTPDGKVQLEHVECNAACDYAPVVMVNWEFFDNQTPDSARQLVDDLRAGNQVSPTRAAPADPSQARSRRDRHAHPGPHRRLGPAGFLHPGRLQARRRLAGAAEGAGHGARRPHHRAEEREPARPRRGRLPDRGEVELPAAG
jgi:NADH-quinone oxidoreductase subunit E